MEQTITKQSGAEPPNPIVRSDLWWWCLMLMPEREKKEKRFPLSTLEAPQAKYFHSRDGRRRRRRRGQQQTGERPLIGFSMPVRPGLEKRDYIAPTEHTRERSKVHQKPRNLVQNLGWACHMCRRFHNWYQYQVPYFSFVPFIRAGTYVSPYVGKHITTLPRRHKVCWRCVCGWLVGPFCYTRARSLFSRTWC